MKHNEKFKIINSFASFVKANEKNFENYYVSFNSRDRKDKGSNHKEEKSRSNNINLIGNKRGKEKSLGSPSKTIKIEFKEKEDAKKEEDKKRN